MPESGPKRWAGEGHLADTHIKESARGAVTSYWGYLSPEAHERLAKSYLLYERCAKVTMHFRRSAGRGAAW